MRRFNTFLLLASLGIASAIAQDNGTGFIGNGFYRVRNLGTQRYIYVTDNRDYYDMSGDDEDFQGIKLWNGAERAAASPASVIFIKNISGNTFDLMAQGTGIHQLTNYYVTVTPKEENTYEVSASKAGVTKYLSDNEVGLDEDEGMLGTGQTGMFRRWIVDKITPDHATNYVGIKPTIHVDGKHYAPYYAAFPFKAVSPNMHIYYARKIRSVEGVTELVLKEIEGDIPESMPVFIECASENPTDNRIEPLTSKPTQISGNLLDGTYFCNGSRPRESVDAYRLFDETTMRIFTVKDGRLVVTNNMQDLFIVDPEEVEDPEQIALNRLVKTRVWNPANPTSPRKVVGYCIPANTSYLTTDANTPSEFGVRFEGVGIDEIIANNKDKSVPGVYTVSGTLLRKTNDVQGLPAGLYIVAGQKVVIK